MQFSRRRFLQNAGRLSAARLAAAVLPGFSETANSIHSKFAYVGARRGIHAFALDGLNWNPVQFVESAAPVSLCLHPLQHVIYAANGIDNDQGLPCGTIEAFAIDSRSGRLSLLRRQRLSLSGIHPRHLAVSPDGAYLAVATRSGTYNLISLDKDGVPEGVSAIFKEAGCGPHPLQQSAAPRYVSFDSRGRLVATDRGCDRVSVFSARRGALVREQRLDAAIGSGPASMAMSSRTGTLYLVHELDGSVTTHNYAESEGKLGGKTRSYPIHNDQITAGHSAIALHPSERFLYVSFLQDRGRHTTSVFEVSGSDGSLTPQQMLDNISMHAVAIDKGGEVLFAADRAANRVLCAAIEPENGTLKQLSPCVSVDSPVCLALKNA